MPGLIPDPHAALLAPPAPPVPPKPAAPGELRAFGDSDRLRKFVYDDVHQAASKLAPVSEGGRTVRLTNVRYADPERFGKRLRKHAVLAGETLGRRLKGTWELVDDASGNVLEKRDQVVARVPYFDSMGTITHRGTSYTINHQQRLRPGVYTRVKENGELEAHANVLPGDGVSHRYMLDPERGIFKIKVGQAEMPLLPLLKTLGATDRELHDAWGGALFSANMRVADAGTVKKLKDRLLSWKDRQDADESSWHAKLVGAFDRMKLEPWISQRTLGHPYPSLGKDAILATTKRLLAVGRGEAEVDDRDHPAYQFFVGPEDMLRERIERDHGRIQRFALRRALREGSLAGMPSGLLTPQIEQLILGSGLAQTVEEINPLEIFDKQGRITRMGEGGLPSLDSVPESARAVQPAHLGMIDPIRTPESMRAGVDLNMAGGAYKGRDGTIYAQFRNPRTHQLEWKSPRDLADAAVAFPGWHTWPTKRVPVMKAGKIDYVKKRDVEYALPHMEAAFSPLGNLVPLKSMVKGQRVAMASRMLTQALPLRDPEAPLVRGALPGTNRQRSYEEEYGKYAGALHADKPGRVVDVLPDAIKVRYDDGTSDEIELYHNFPMARKTLYHQTPTVAPGQPFRPGDLLARSNYTDAAGAAALGVNARVAYVPWKGLNYEDAIAISESMAKRLTSEHAYQHALEVTDRHKLGRGMYHSLFPARFPREALERLDDQGVIRPGQAVNYGDPLIVAAKERDTPQTRIHKKRQPGYADASVTWDHHDPGIVTDVVWGKHGPTVMVKSYAAMRIGDKLSGRYGDKGVISAIIPDHEMPHDRDGVPYEVLANPLGVISRTNPAQMAEAWLGKIAARTGQPYRVEDFAGVPDMMAHVQQELARHGLSGTEEIIDPTLGKRIPGIATGNRFFMKLHHSAESKVQSRGSGGYSMDETPARGGETGCFTADTLIEFTPAGHGETVAMPIGVVAEARLLGLATARDPAAGHVAAAVTDWFCCRVPSESLIEIELDNGLRFTVTKTHVMYRADGTRVLAGALEPGDDLLE